MLTLGLLLGATCVRVGFEDNVYLRRGQLAASNAELVEQIAAIARSLGREVATVEQARELLSLPQPAGVRAMTYRISVDTGGTFTDIVVSRRVGPARARQGADHARPRLRGAARGHRPGRRAPRARGRGAARADRGADLRHDARDERDRRGQDRAHGVLHDRGLPRHPARARGRQARPVQADPVPGPVRSALADVRDPRAHGLPRASRSSRSTRRPWWTRSAGRASCVPRRSRSACCGRSSTRRTSSAWASWLQATADSRKYSSAFL